MIEKKMAQQTTEDGIVLAIFDLDGTILDGDSDYQWNIYLIEKKIVDGKSYLSKNDFYYQQYLEGKLNIHEYQSFSLSSIKNLSLKEIEKIREDFLQEKILPLIKAKALSQIDWHLQRGHQLMMISATNEIVITPIANHLKIPIVMGCIPEIKDGHLTGKLLGEPSFREGKVVRLFQWLEQKGIDKTVLQRSYYYGDSQNDQFVMKEVGMPVAVDPDKNLSSISEKNQWKIVSWTESKK